MCKPQTEFRGSRNEAIRRLSMTVTEDRVSSTFGVII